MIAAGHPNLVVLQKDRYMNFLKKKLFTKPTKY